MAACKIANMGVGNPNWANLPDSATTIVEAAALFHVGERSVKSEVDGDGVLCQNLICGRVGKSDHKPIVGGGYDGGSRGYGK